jgi:hypothetical protein
MLLEGRAVAGWTACSAALSRNSYCSQNWREVGTHFHFLWWTAGETALPRSSMRLRLSLLPYSAKEILWLINILRVS